MKKIQIGNHCFTQNPSPFIVAEVGINHNGDLEKAFEMIKVAKDAGCNSVKFQTFKVNELIEDPNLTYTYKSQGKEVTESMLDLFTKYEFNEKQWFKIKERCVQEKIHFLSTPQNYSDLEILQKVGVDAIKVGSDDFNNVHLLKKYTQSKLPIILSTGMANEEEIQFSLEEVGALEGYPIILLLCVSQYPTPLEAANLSRLLTLKKKYPEIPIGFSDHTEGSFASTLAVANGAVFIEKHFTLDKDLPGPDHWFSSNPEELKELVENCHLAYRAMGSSELSPSKEEVEMRKLARRSVFVITDIKKGDLFTESNLGLRRPGTGIEPKDYESILGKQAKNNIDSGTLLSTKDY
jgi:N,N'-diacetyllegionaminate synthase